MVVEHYVVDARAGSHEAVPVGDGVEECVVDYDCGVAVGVADVAPAVVVEFLQSALVEVGAHGLI